MIRVERGGEGLRLAVRSPGKGYEVRRGQSVAVSGACLTHVGAEGAGEELVFDLSAETLLRTHLGRARVGQHVNLERALRLGDRLDGHLVAGHIDGVGKLLTIDRTSDGGARIEVEVPEGLERYLIDKGSVTLDGVSLTVVSPRGRRFAVALIPLTITQTGFAHARAGDELNVEADMIGKWLDKLRP
ncbi:MAG: riboflavin synthase [Planctomycetes bacterium]|nr:riboflavin synthase [Planctomycetota bacterium]